MKINSCGEKLLEGRKVFVTGASRGIGRAIAEVFAEQGAELHLNALNSETLEHTADSIRAQHNVSVTTYVFDVSDDQTVKNAFQRYHKANKNLDVLVNNAGVMNDGLLAMLTSQKLDHTFSVNVFGAVYCAQYASRLMVRQQQGSIINIGSIVGENGRAGQSMYGASKAAVTSLTKTWAKEFGGSNIRVNAICPGLIDTDLLGTLTNDDKRSAIENVGLGRIGKAEEVARAALFLASDWSSYITGQVLGVDGGMVI